MMTVSEREVEMKMYQLVIADDEEVIRRGLAELVDWRGLGFELAACLCDGDEVIAFLKEHPVDVVFTDIRMAGVSGIDLAQYVARERLPVKIVFLSGYKEFEFARQAIVCGVESYLLKPTKFDEVVEVFKELRNKLDRQAEESRLQQQYQEMIPLIREQFIADLFGGVFRDKASLDMRLDALQCEESFRNSPCSALTLRILERDRYLCEKWQYGKETLKNAVGNFLHGKKTDFTFLHTFSSGDRLDILAVSSAKATTSAMEADLRLWAEELRRQLSDEMKLNVEIRQLGCYSTVYELAQHIKIPIKNEQDVQKPDTRRLDEVYRMILSKVAAGSLDEADNLIETLFEGLTHFPQTVAADVLKKFMESATLQAQQMGVSLNEPCKNLKTAKTPVKNMQAARDAALDTVERIDRQSAEKNLSPTKLLVARARQLIEENYDKDISLEEIADKVFLNPTYLGRIFKQQVGESFTDYLTKTRINRAAELLAQKKYRLDEISVMTGYKNSRYFCKVFRLQTGLTPKEYFYRHLLQTKTGDSGA